jgi:hypothetical protein
VNSSFSRGVTLVAIALSTAGVAFLAWPRPAVLLRVERGGRAVVVDQFGRTTPLPETLFVSAAGRATKVRIENRDTTYQTLGIFGAAANSSRSFSVPLPGVYGGYCSAHASSKQLTYVVR